MVEFVRKYLYVCDLGEVGVYNIILIALYDLLDLVAHDHLLVLQHVVSHVCRAVNKPPHPLQLF